MKLCLKCKQKKLFFGKDSSRVDGLNVYCKDCINESSRQKVALNREIYNKYRREKYKNNKERKLYLENWKSLNKEKTLQYKRKWKKKNLDKVAANSALYRSAKLQRTPPWLTKAQHEEIADIYKQAKELEAIFFNRKFHVDHIIPLQGKDVCGLHVPWNLQILTAEENTTKSNKVKEQ